MEEKKTPRLLVGIGRNELEERGPQKIAAGKEGRDHRTSGKSGV